jgi:hypothetical protein
MGLVPTTAWLRSSQRRRTCTADDVVAIIERLVAQRGAPEHLRMDNCTSGSEDGPRKRTG